MISSLLAKLRDTPKQLYLVYLATFIPAGFFMNQFGIWTNIARFENWWQVFTCYGLYMIPIAVLLRELKFHEQYLWGLFSMCLLEFMGYALGTSVALGISEGPSVLKIEGNLLAEIVNVKNFTLSMALFFGLYYPAGNWLVDRVYKKLS